MKMNLKSVFLLTILFITYSAQAQNCSQGNENSKRTYSLYKEYYKQGDIDRALPYWREVHQNAPGLTKSIFVDGADMYEALITKTTDENLKQKYVDTLMNLYDQRIQCWGDKGYVLQLKGINLARFRPDQYPAAVKILEEAVHLDQIDSKYYGVATYFNLLVNLKDKVPGINEDFIKKEYQFLVAICDSNIQANDNAEAFANVKNDMTYNLQKFVLPQRFADGAAWYSWTVEQKTDSLKKWIVEDSSASNLQDIVTHISRDKDLKDSDIRYQIEEILFAETPSAISANNIGAHYYETKQFAKAVPFFEKAIALTEDNKGKANLYLALADTYRQADQFTESRDAARQAINLDSTSAKPYYLIGVLYLSSGKKCGSGTGFNSQRVIWPAFDYLKKAEQLDSTYTEIVEPLMRDYKKFLPTRTEIASKGLKAGGTYFVPCWIQEDATVVAKD